MAKLALEKAWFKSKKLWMATATLLLVVGTEVLGIGMDTDKILGMVSVALGYILSQGHVDAKVRAASLLSEAAIASGKALK